MYLPCLCLPPDHWVCRRGLESPRHSIQHGASEWRNLLPTTKDTKISDLWTDLSPHDQFTYNCFLTPAHISNRTLVLFCPIRNDISYHRQSLSRGIVGLLTTTGWKTIQHFLCQNPKIVTLQSEGYGLLLNYTSQSTEMMWSSSVLHSYVSLGMFFFSCFRTAAKIWY